MLRKNKDKVIVISLTLQTIQEIGKINPIKGIKINRSSRLYLIEVIPELKTKEILGVKGILEIKTNQILVLKISQMLELKIKDLIHSKKL